MDSGGAWAWGARAWARERGALTAEQEHPAVQEDTDTVGTADDEASPIQTNGSAPSNTALAAEDQVEEKEAVEATERN